MLPNGLFRMPSGHSTPQTVHSNGHRIQFKPLLLASCRIQSQTLETGCLRPSLPPARLVAFPSTLRRKKLAQAAAVASTAPLSIIPTALSPAAVTPYLFAMCSAFAAAVVLLMAVAPKWRFTQRLIRSPWVLVPIAVVYGLLLSWSWQPDTFSLILPGSLADGLKGGFNPQFFPKISGIVALFSRIPTAASLWVHLVAVDLFAARAVYFDGELSLGII